jgi:hypothetical protein
MVLRWVVQDLQSLQKFERPQFWNGCSYGINNYGLEVIFNGVVSLLNFIKTYQLVQKLTWGDTHTHTHTHARARVGDLIILHFSFRKGSTLKNWALHKPLGVFERITKSVVLQLYELGLVTLSNSELLFWKYESFRLLVRLLGRGIRPTQGLYLNRTTQHKEKDKHPSQNHDLSDQAFKAYASDRAATGTGITKKQRILLM